MSAMPKFKLLIAVCFLAAQAVNAFRDSSPLVAWSGYQSSADSQFPEEDTLSLLLENDALCSYNSVTIIDQPGVRSSDLRALHASSVLSVNLKDAPFSHQMPYTWTLSSNDLAGAVETLASRCEAQLVQFDPQHGTFHPSSSGSNKRVVYAQLPPLPHGCGRDRKHAMAEQEESLSKLVAAVSNVYPNSLFIYSGSIPSKITGLTKRQAESISLAFAPSNSTTGGILAHYQLLTPGLILTLAVAFFVALPIVFVGISALSQIEATVTKVDMKGSSVDKKNQ